MVKDVRVQLPRRLQAPRLERRLMARAAAGAAKAQLESFLVRWVPGLKALWITSKFYFAVDSAYVGKKLGALLWPWTRKEWKRQWDSVPIDSSGATTVMPRPPSKDSNAPDLYIPTMALVTFILSVGLVKGVALKFTPDVLTEVTGSCLLASFLEALVVYGVIYLSVSSSALRGVGFADLLALSSYKYVGLVLAFVAGLLGGDIAFYALLAYTAASTAFAHSRWLGEALAGSVPVSAEGRGRMAVFVAAGAHLLATVYLARH